MKWITMIVLASGSMAMAQTQEAPALKGPSVSESAAKPTLIERDFAGKLKRLDVSAEEGALRLMKLAPVESEKADRIIAERAAIIDRAVIEDLDTVIQIHNAGLNGDKAEAIRLLQEFAKHLEPLKSRGKLMDELAGALDEANRERFRALVQEYRAAALQDTIEQATSRGEKLTRPQAMGREVALAVGLEIKRSYQRQITSKTEDFERLLASLSLKPEQETKVRNAVTDYVQQTKGKPTPEQKRQIFWKIYGELDKTQRRQLVDYYKSLK